MPDNFVKGNNVNVAAKRKEGRSGKWNGMRQKAKCLSDILGLKASLREQNFNHYESYQSHSKQKKKESLKQTNNKTASKILAKYNRSI